MRNDFCVFILSHGRPDNVKTIKALKKAGYTGRTFVILDDTDCKADEYRKKFGNENILIFDKLYYFNAIDTMTTDGNMKAIVFARNAAFDLARKLGIRYFLELDDDYNRFEFRFVDRGRLKSLQIRNLDDIIDAMIDFLVATNADTVAFAQGGDFVGGAQGGNANKVVSRKAMNTFFCRTDRPCGFFGILNEDVNFYTYGGLRGRLILSNMLVSIVQTPTQQSAEGMTDIYKSVGTYTKSLYSVMACPSCVKISLMTGGTRSSRKHYRVHHNVMWEHCVPKIISAKWRKDLITTV